MNLEALPARGRTIDNGREPWKAVLHLTEHYGDGSACAKMFIGIDDLDELHQKIMERPNPYMRPGIRSGRMAREIHDSHRPVRQSSRICGEIIFLERLNSERT